MNSIKILVFLLGCFTVCCAQTGNPPKTRPATMQAETNATYTYKVIQAPRNTYGYDIFSDGKLMIHQPSVPGEPGNNGFKTQKSAETVAKLVIEKIKKGEMPPTVSREEMQKLKAIN
jgi:hypothetical protein